MKKIKVETVYEFRKVQDVRAKDEKAALKKLEKKGGAGIYPKKRHFLDSDFPYGCSLVCCEIIKPHKKDDKVFYLCNSVYTVQLKGSLFENGEIVADRYYMCLEKDQKLCESVKIIECIRADGVKISGDDLKDPLKLKEFFDGEPEKINGLEPWQEFAVNQWYEEDKRKELETEEPMDLWDDNDPLTQRLMDELERREAEREKEAAKKAAAKKPQSKKATAKKMATPKKTKKTRVKKPKSKKSAE